MNVVYLMLSSQIIYDYAYGAVTATLQRIVYVDIRRKSRIVEHVRWNVHRRVY